MPEKQGHFYASFRNVGMVLMQQQSLWRMSRRCRMRAKTTLSPCHLWCHMSKTSTTIKTAVTSAIVGHKWLLPWPQSNSTHASTESYWKACSSTMTTTKSSTEFVINGFLRTTRTQVMPSQRVLRCSNFPSVCLLQICISIG